MQEFITNMQMMLEVYRSFGKITLLLVAILGLLTVKMNQKKRVIVFYVIIASILILNPFFVSKEIQVFGSTNLYRLGMVLLIPIVSAYALTTIYGKVNDCKKRVIVMTGILFLIGSSANFVYTNQHFFELNNEEKVYDLAVNIADCVTISDYSPKVAISEIQGVFIRQYNPDIKLLVAPKVTENWVEAEDERILTMRIMLADPVPDMPALSNLSNELGCDFLVLMDDQLKQDSPQNYGFQYIDTFGVFQVFENRIGVK